MTEEQRNKIIEEIMKEQAEKMRDKIFGSFRNPFQHHRNSVFYPERPKGSVDLFSPDGELLMRDGELVEKRGRRFK